MGVWGSKVSNINEYFSWSLMKKGKQIHIGHIDIKINYTESDSNRQVGSLSLLKVGEREDY